MLYCCGSKDGDSVNGEKALVRRPSEGESVNAPPEPEMYGMSGMPDLLPPASSLQPAAVHVQAMENGLDRQLSFDSPQRRLGQRAPKLGQIGRSKRGECGSGSLKDYIHARMLCAHGCLSVGYSIISALGVETRDQ